MNTWGSSIVGQAPYIACKYSLEAGAQSCTVKKVVLTISPNSQESTFLQASSLIKFQAKSLQLNLKETPT